MFHNGKVLPGVSLDADHRMVVAVLRVKSLSKASVQRKKILSLKSLKEQSIKEEFRELITDKITEH